MGATAAWAIGIAGGGWWLTDYSSRPGDAGQPRVSWPAESPIPLDPHRLTLVMIAHPRCPCTSASVAELERLLAAAGDGVRAWVLLSVPASAAGDAGWANGSLQHRLEAMPGVSTRLMDADRVAALFGAATSGHLLAYSPDGALRFSGGITIARGHEGDSIGADAVRDLAEGRATATAATPVFGCPLVRTASGGTL